MKKQKHKNILDFIKFRIKENYKNYDFPRSNDNEISMLSVRNDLLFENLGICLR